jgi:hypothetical protein
MKVAVVSDTEHPPQEISPKPISHRQRDHPFDHSYKNAPETVPSHADKLPHFAPPIKCAKPEIQ